MAAKTGQPRKPVSRKKAAGTNNKKTRKVSKRPPMALPKPDRLTFVIVAVGAVLLVGLMFLVVRPTANAAATAATERAQSEQELVTAESQLGEYESKQVYAGQALSAVVGSAEAYLPSLDELGTVNSEVLKLVDGATAAGVSVDSFVTDGDFVDDKGAKRYTFPLSVSGSLGSLTQWLTQLHERQPLVTFTTTGAALSDGAVTMDLDVSLWATSAPALGSGGAAQGSPANLSGLEGLTGNVGG